MKSTSCFLYFLFLVIKASAQGFLITSPKLEFNNNRLFITYDIVSKEQSDQFYVWVEIEKSDGEKLDLKAFTGALGANIKPGEGKQIIWTPGNDNTFLNEEVNVVVKAEKYLKSFNKGSAIFSSAILPGLGQTKISKGKPWWLTGVATYGALSSGFLFHKKYVDSYNSYRIEEDPIKRTELLNKAQQQLKISNVLCVSGVVCWAANIFWVSVKPNRFRPLQHASLSINQLNMPNQNTTLLSFKVNF